MKCPKCGSTNITVDHDQGESICECGNVLQRGGIVNSVEFNNIGNRSKVSVSIICRFMGVSLTKTHPAMACSQAIIIYLVNPAR